MAARIPVTVLTGFLGSGKTTLLNRILTESHGQRIAVIENEFGEIGVDQDLVINADEEIFEMNNGCICCTVRGDLIRILGNLARRRDRFDRIVLETTGLADPGPVAQTFFVDDEVRDRFYVDGIITLVDALHIEQHIDNSAEALAQIGFADLLILNKTDLVGAEDVDRLITRLRGINSLARVLPAKMADVPVDRVLEVGGFNIEEALVRNPQFLEPEYPFEWAGSCDLDAGQYTFACQDAPDPSMDLLCIAMDTRNEVELAERAETVFRLFSEIGREVPAGGVITPGEHLWQLNTREAPCRFALSVPNGGRFGIFLQHMPDEFNVRLLRADGSEVAFVHAHAFNPGHTHDDTVTSVSVESRTDLDERRFNEFIRRLQSTRGADIFRMKGIVSLSGEPRQVVIQGVHMLLDVAEGGRWAGTERRSRMVFIGRNLDAAALRAAFAACAA